MKIALPQPVRNIIETLESRGYEAYAVGGCVRDSILGKTPHDWDITTSATPVQIKTCFSHTIDTGIQHGTVTVLQRKETVLADPAPGESPLWDAFEVTTYRIDGSYADGRHPDSVTFTPLLSEDLKRRDFTINAMAYSDRGGLVDLFGGQEDLRTLTIRCVGDPAERFSEDALRMMRAVRFAAQLDAVLAPDTEAAIAALAPTLARVSAERIRDEFCKLLTSPHPERLRDLYRLGLTRVFLPEWNALCVTPQNTPHHMYDVGEHTIAVLAALADGSTDRCWEDAGINDYPLRRSERDELLLRLSAVLHDISKPECRTTDEFGVDHFHGHPVRGAEVSRGILHRLRLDNDAVSRVTGLVRWHDERPKTAHAVRRLASKMSPEDFVLLQQLRMADVLGQSRWRRAEKIELITDNWNVYADIRRKNQALSVRDLAVNGRDLLDIGIPAGPRIGETLFELLELVLEQPEMNNREALLNAAASFIQNCRTSQPLPPR